jgi:hypothetical protein
VYFAREADSLHLSIRRATNRELLTSAGLLVDDPLSKASRMMSWPAPGGP